MALSTLCPSSQISDRLFRSGEAVPTGTYVSLEDGRFVFVAEGECLPPSEVLPCFYLYVSNAAYNASIRNTTAQAA
jgi:hypothetical protein